VGGGAASGAASVIVCLFVAVLVSRGRIACG